MPDSGSPAAQIPMPERVLAAPLRVRRPIRRRIVRESVLIAALAVMSVSLLSIVVARAVLTERTLSELSAIASARKDILESAIQRDRERTAYIAKRGEILSAVASHSTGSASTVFQQLLDQGVSVEGLTIFDSRGQVVGSLGTASAPPEEESAVTRVVPTVDALGVWRSYDVYARIPDDFGNSAGTLALRYDVTPLLQSLFQNLDIGQTGEMVIGRSAGGKMTLLNHFIDNGDLHTFSVGALDPTSPEQQMLTRAATGAEGADTLEGGVVPLLVAYRSLPSIGWGLVVSVQRSQALAPIQAFAVELVLMSILLIVLATVIGIVLARSLSAPLVRLSQSLTQLNPGNWSFARSVRTGDEVEVLDSVIADLTARLKTTYDHLEELVAERTRELHKEYALDRAILEGIEYGVVSVDNQGIVTDVNPAFTRLLGYQDTECIGKPGTLFMTLLKGLQPVPDNAHPLLQSLQTKSVFRSTESMKLTLIRKDHGQLPVLLMVSPLTQGDQLLGAIAIFQDVTEDRKIDEMKSEFITLASHQLRTPLSAIRWNLELLRGEDKPLPPEHLPYMGEIDHSSARMSSILDSLLQAARLEEGGYVSEKKNLDLLGLIKQLVDEHQLQADMAKVKILLSLPATLPTLQTDALFMDIIITNLLSNAIMYSTAGGDVELGVKQDGEAIILTVTDHGMGIPQSEQGRVFQKFYRGINIRQASTDGNGLGLYITKRAVENLGGTISFQSTEGKGTTFTVTLPIA